MLADDLIEQLRLLTTLILAWREGKGVEKDQIEQVGEIAMYCFIFVLNTNITIK